MNLVAKEYVACHRNRPGVLVLSEFAGAAEQLKSALLVNPYDVDAVAETLRVATTMDRAEAITRMQRLGRTVRREDVFEWARDCLAMLEAF
jgi:trehalose 6-phosphate synthase